MEAKRDRLRAGLAEAGFEVATCDGTYFINAGIGGLCRDGESDVDFCRRLVTEVGVAAIPVSAFYLEAEVKDTVRFCFAKSDATLDEALARLARLA